MDGFARTVVLKHCHILESDYTSNRLIENPSATGIFSFPVGSNMLPVERTGVLEGKDLSGKKTKKQKTKKQKDFSSKEGLSLRFFFFFFGSSFYD